MAYLQDQFATASEVTEIELRSALDSMAADDTMITPSSYNANAVLYPDHQESFTNKHLAYLKAHPKMNAEQYLANVRLKIRIR